MFVASDPSTADCSSAPDGQKVDSIRAADLEELRAGPLTMTFLPQEPTGGSTLSFSVDGFDVSNDGSGGAAWAGGFVQIEDLGPGASSGTIVFGGLSWTDPLVKYDPTAPAPSPTGGWPATLSGTLTWTCRPW